MKAHLIYLPLLTISLLNLSAADWPGWRGPQTHGISSERNLPLTWGPGTNLAWQVEPPGKGASSPVIIGDRLYLTTQQDDDSLRVLAYDSANGALRWNQSVGSGRGRTHDLINMATPTVAAEAQHVWAFFGTGLLVCLDKDGKTVWQRDLAKAHGALNTMWGTGTSPILHDGKLLLAIMHQGPSYVLAVDATTGADLWKTPRDHGAKDEAKDSYSSPTLATVDGRTQLIVSGGDHLDAYDPATGERLWANGGLEVPHPYGRTISSPTAAGDLVLTVASGFQNRGHVLAVRAGGKEKEQLWTSSRYSPDCPSPVIYNGYAFTLRDDGNAQCLDLRTGEAHWQERLFSENVKVSPVAADGRIYFLSGRGNCVVVQADQTFEVLARNEFNEDTLAAPAIAHGRIYLRTSKTLYAIGSPNP